MITFHYFTPTHNPAMNRKVGEFTAKVIWGRGSFGPHSSLGVFEDGELIAGMIYHNWDEHSEVMEISGGSTTKRWLQPPVLHALFDFPFRQVGAQMVVMRVSDKDRSLVRLLKRFGFTGVLVPRLRGRHKDEWVLTLTDDCWSKLDIAKRYPIK